MESCPFRRFRRWTLKVFESLFEALSGDPDFEYAIIDGTIVRVHQHGIGAKGDSKSGHWPVATWPDHQDRRNVTRSTISQASFFRPASATPAPGSRHGSRKSHATLCAATRSSTMIGGAPEPSSRRRPAVAARFPAIWTSTNGLYKWSLQMVSPNGVISSNASSAIVTSSGAWPPATKKPTKATLL